MCCSDAVQPPYEKNGPLVVEFENLENKVDVYMNAKIHFPEQKSYDSLV